MENLRDLNISSVTLTGGIYPGEEGDERLSNTLSRHQDNWPRRSIDKLGFYEADGIRHHVGLDIETDRVANPNIVLFTLETHSFSRSERLRPERRRRQERQFLEIQAILSDLGELSLNSRIHSHISWIFPPDSRRSIISLPMMTVQSPNIPFTEISGIRLNKEAREGLTTVTIDLRRNRSLAVTLVFPMPEVEISERIIKYTVQRGSHIIGDFILDVEIPSEGGET